MRASSNKPELVVVVESPVSEARMREMFKAVDAVLRQDQTTDDIIRNLSSDRLIIFPDFLVLPTAHKRLQHIDRERKHN